MSAPLSPDQINAITDAALRRRPLERTARVARFGGWTTGFFAFFALLSGLFSLPALLLGIAMSLAAFHEFRGGRRVLRADPKAPAFLAWNQVFLWAAITTYCVFSALTPTETHALADAAAADPQMARLVEDTERLARVISLAVYGLVALGSLLFQGLTAWYYFTRAKHVRAYLASTPEWVRDIQRVAA